MKKRVIKDQGKETHHKGLHPRNVHRDGYDFAALTESHPALAKHVKVNEHGGESIDFSDPLAVKALNGALLKQFLSA